MAYVARARLEAGHVLLALTAVAKAADFAPENVEIAVELMRIRGIREEQRRRQKRRWQQMGMCIT